MQHGQLSASCLVQPSEVKKKKKKKKSSQEVKSCIKDDQLLLACGKKIPLLSSACVELLSGLRSKMPVVKGRVGEKPADVLRDTGCSGIVVKRELVSKDQFTVNFNVMLLIDNTARKVPITRIDVNTPYLNWAKWKRSVFLMRFMHQSIPAVPIPPPPGQPQGICSRCQSWGWGIRNFIAAPGAGH